MQKFAFYAQLKPKPGKEKELEDFIAQGDVHTREDKTILQSFSMKTEDGTYCLFDVFETSPLRSKHFEGETAEKLNAVTSSLLIEPPQVQLLEIVRQK